MQTSPSHNPQAIARQHVLNGQPIPAYVAAQLEAINIDVGALEYRLRQSQEFRQ